jgi:hypothetical protein
MTTQRRAGDVLLADIVSPQFVSANIALFFSVVEVMKFVNQISMLQRSVFWRDLRRSWTGTVGWKRALGPALWSVS